MNTLTKVLLRNRQMFIKMLLNALCLIVCFFYSGLANSVMPLGPVIGFALAALCTRLPENLISKYLLYHETKFFCPCFVLVNKRIILNPP